MGCINMCRKTVGLYKRYKFGPCAGVWSINFKRPLNWFFEALPSLRIPSDLINDYPEWVGNEALTWKIVMLRDPLDEEPVVFYSDISKVFTASSIDKYQFVIPQPLWDLLKEEGLRKEWFIILCPYNYLIWDEVNCRNGGIDQFDIRFCAGRYGGYINEVVNNGLDFGTLFGWLYGEDYSALYTKWECPVQIPAKPLSSQCGELIIMKGD